LVRFYHPDLGERLGVQQGDNVHDVTAFAGSVWQWLRSSSGRVGMAIQELVESARAADTAFPARIFDRVPSPQQPHWLPPVDLQEVWAAGVTYLRSRDARQVEAVDGGDVYARVYLAQRPELFFKARGAAVVGPRGDVGIRRDAGWSVPEPELALVINPALEVVGWTAGNDMSSRDLEGENPLYLPQAKIYTGSCALGPGIVLEPVAGRWPDVAIGVAIERGGRVAFAGETHTSQIRRRPDELVEYLGRCLAFPDGAVLMTGTGIVPPEEFTLAAGDVVQITVGGLSPLINTVRVV
jgi:2-dehydro-3-deoxy-D-arabinonate dehydratase